MSKRKLPCEETVIEKHKEAAIVAKLQFPISRESSRGWNFQKPALTTLFSDPFSIHSKLKNIKGANNEEIFVDTCVEETGKVVSVIHCGELAKTIV